MITNQIGRWTYRSGRQSRTVVGMVRPFRQQIDEGILDRAAALFARRGFAKTSVQEVADAVGLSKAGLLHHFPSKDALHEAVLAQAGTLGQRLLDQVRDLPPSATRDRRVVEVMVDLALARPGLVALLLSSATALDAAANGPELEATSALVFEAFGADPAECEPERLIRITGTMAALGVLTLAAHQAGETTAWRQHIVATCFDALGHRSPGAALPDSDQVEA
jgi:AcrR family transcriptional regulator